jgi:CheY-like chemotaxis protein
MDRKRVLLVDDYAAFANSLRLALLDAHDVVVATSGDQALKELERGTFDVVLCDLMMPQLSGAELHERISELWPGLEQRMIFMTGGSYTPETNQFLRRVPNPRLEKPFQMDELRSLLETRRPGAP